MMQQLALDTRNLEPQSPRELMEDAYLWVKANPLLWRREFVDRAFADMDGRVSVKRYIEDARAAHHAVVRIDGQPFAIRNAFSPAFARMLRAWHPELAQAIPLAASVLDGVVVPRKPY